MSPDAAKPARRRPTPTEFVRSHYDRTASGYDRKIAVAERLLFAGGRAWATGRASGRTLEVAVGTGRNLAHYRPPVQVTGIDLSAGMIGVARARADLPGVDVELVVGDAQQLAFQDDSFDTVVATLALCSIPDDEAAVAEMARVLRPGGRLLLLEHVRSPVRVVRVVQRLLQPLFLRLEGDHLLREPELAVVASGLQVDQMQRSKLGLVLRLEAHKPA